MRVEIGNGIHEIVKQDLEQAAKRNETIKNDENGDES